MTAPDPAVARERLQRDYRPAFLRYLSRRDEPARTVGYELGRAAVASGQSMLDVVAAHHVTLAEVLPDARDPAEVLSMSTAASEFLTEVLASFSMTTGAVASMAEQLEDAQRELAALRAQGAAPTGGADGPVDRSSRRTGRADGPVEPADRLSRRGPGHRTGMPPAPGSRIVLLTGASSGIGRESALRFARLGDTVVGVASREPALRELAEQQPGIEVEVCDLLVTEERAALVERVLARHGRVDVLVNNAGVGAVGLLHELTARDVERVYTTNVTAYADLTRLVLPGMLARRSGAVVMLSSAAAWISGPPSTVYASSKFAVDGLVEGLRRETHGTGVLVHSVNPGPVATDYLLRTQEASRQPGDPDVPLAPGVPASWVADAVVAVAASSSAATRAVPRVVGVTRLAQLPPVGLVVDVVLGRYAASAVAGTRRMVDRRVRALLGR